MKDVLHYLDIVEIHASDFNCDVDSGSDGPAATDQDIPSESTPPTNHKNTFYWLPPLLSKGLMPISGHI